MKKILVIIIIILIFGGIGIGIKKVVDDFNYERKQIDEQNKLDDYNASLIIQSVELAYTNAVVNNMGIYPTIDQIKSNFENENAKWVDDDKITSQNFDCTVNVENKILVVKCLNYTTNESLKIRN